MVIASHEKSNDPGSMLEQGRHLFSAFKNRPISANNNSTTVTGLLSETDCCPNPNFRFSDNRPLRTRIHLADSCPNLHDYRARYFPTIEGWNANVSCYM